MWADVFLQLERDHLLRLAAWGASSVLLGTLVLAWVAVRHRDSVLLQHFAIQSVAWGAVDLGVCAWGWQGLALRDLEGATRLVNVLWLNVGLDAGYVGIGLALVLCGWRLGRRVGLVGAGCGIMVQGLALALLDLVLLANIASARVS